MQPTLKFAVVGNCQANPLSTIITALAPHLSTERVIIVHLASEEDRDEDYRALDSVDFILAQRVVDNYPREHVRNALIKENFGDKVLVWPNLYYRGYNPELTYLRDENRRVLQGPLGDYHLTTVHDAWKHGLSAPDAEARLKSGDFNRELFAGVPQDSLAELEERELDCDVTISNWVRAEVWNRRLFFTFNHPTTGALFELAERILSRLEINSEGASRANGVFEREPLGRWRIPLNAWISQDLAGRDLVDYPTYRGNEVTLLDGSVRAEKPVVELTHIEVVESYYRIYDHIFGERRGD